MGSVAAGVDERHTSCGAQSPRPGTQITGGGDLNFSRGLLVTGRVRAAGEQADARSRSRVLRC